MAELSDIEPVNQQFFSSILSNEDLSLSAKRRLVDTALGGRLDLEKARSAIARNRQQEKLNDLRIQEDEVRLAEARSAAEKKIKTNQGVGLLKKTVQQIHASPLSPLRKLEEYDAIAINHPDLVAADPSLQAQIRAARGSLPPAQSAAAQQSAEVHALRMQQGYRAEREGAVARDLIDEEQELKSLEKVRETISQARTPYTRGQLRDAIQAKKDSWEDKDNDGNRINPGEWDDSWVPPDADEYADANDKYVIERFVLGNQPLAEKAGVKWSGAWSEYVTGIDRKTGERISPGLGFAALQDLARRMAYPRIEDLQSVITQSRQTLKPGAAAEVTDPRGPNPLGPQEIPLQ